MPRCLRLRFSLRRLLASLFLLSLVGSNFYVSYKWRQSQTENERLRNELGYLTITDPSRIYVCEMPTFEPLSWKWRIYMPPGGRTLCTATGRITATGFNGGSVAKHGPAWPVDPLQGEYTLTARVERDQHGGWRLAITYPDGRNTLGFTPPDAQWLVDDGYFVSSPRKLHVDIAGAKKETQSFAADDTVVLLRLRAPDVQKSGSDKPCDGVMVWFEKFQEPHGKQGKAQHTKNAVVPPGQPRTGL